MAQPIPPTRRYIRPGVTRVYWVVTISDIADPERGELDAGTDLSPEVAEIQGFDVTAQLLDVAHYASSFGDQAVGGTGVSPSALLTYADEESVDVRSTLSPGDSGHVVIMDEGDVEGHLMDIYPAQVAAATKLRGDLSLIRFAFAITSAPALDVPVPGES